MKPDHEAASQQISDKEKTGALPGEERQGRRQVWLRSPATWAFITLVILVALYLATMARELVWGDPTEYTFVANMLGIAHPPGYTLIILLGKLIQTLIPIGDIPWRMHLLSVIVSIVAAIFVYGTIVSLSRGDVQAKRLGAISYLVALLTGLLVTTAADWWQHAIHTNPHIITATFLAANLFFLTRWWAIQRPDEKTAANQANRWLYVFSFSAGLGITHHPLTAFSFPAYAILILWLRPGIWRSWRTWLAMLGCALLGLSTWLYLPIRSSMAPAFGPDDMATLNGFLDHVLARGLTESLPFYGLADLLDRATVFWTLLRLQYSLPMIFLAAFGLGWLSFNGGRKRTLLAPGEKAGPKQRRSSLRPLALLYGLALVSNYLFVMNLRAQDIMAYLLGIFLVIGVLAGCGIWGLLVLVENRLRFNRMPIALLLGALFLLGPLLQIIRNAPRISLANYSEAAEYSVDVFEWFDGQGEGAILLNDWEHMTPLWYDLYVEEHWPDPNDVTPVLVSTEQPWLESVFYYLPEHPVYLSGYRAEVVSAGFRLRPRGQFYQVVEPGDTSIPAGLRPLAPEDPGVIELVAYQMAKQQVKAGEYVPLTLAMRTHSLTADYYVPVLEIRLDDGPISYEFTTDSHLITLLWLPGEVIIERFDFALPHDIEEGQYPVSVRLRNLSTHADEGEEIVLDDIQVVGEPSTPVTDNLLANFRQQVALANASAGNSWLIRREAPWSEPITAKTGDTIHVTLEWLSLAPAGESYTVFLHLIDQANRPLVTLDYTPLGGSAPTHLWIPKWLPGQRMLDPYRLEVPEELAPGTYYIEAGLYEMTGKRRLHISDQEGNLDGDRFILGPVQITE